MEAAACGHFWEAVGRCAERALLADDTSLNPDSHWWFPEHDEPEGTATAPPPGTTLDIRVHTEEFVRVLDAHRPAFGMWMRWGAAAGRGGDGVESFAEALMQAFGEKTGEPPRPPPVNSSDTSLLQRFVGVWPHHPALSHPAVVVYDVAADAVDPDHVPAEATTLNLLHVTHLVPLEDPFTLALHTPSARWTVSAPTQTAFTRLLDVLCASAVPDAVPPQWASHAFLSPGTTEGSAAAGLDAAAAAIPASPILRGEVALPPTAATPPLATPPPTTPGLPSTTPSPEAFDCTQRVTVGELLSKVASRFNLPRGTAPDTAREAPHGAHLVLGRQRFVFKAVGLNEFALTPGRHLLDMTYVQDCLRESLPITLAVVPWEAFEAAAAAPPPAPALTSQPSLLLTPEADEVADGFVPEGLGHPSRPPPTLSPAALAAVADAVPGGLLPLAVVTWPLRVRVLAVRGVRAEVTHVQWSHGDLLATVTPLESPPVTLAVKASVVYQGAVVPGCVMQSPHRPFGPEAAWHPPRWLSTSIPAKDIPQGSRVVFHVACLCRDAVESTTLAGVAVPLTDHRGHLVAGRHALRLWTNRYDVASAPPGPPLEPAPVGAPGDGGVELEVEFEAFAAPVAGNPPPAVWALRNATPPNVAALCQDVEDADRADPAAVAALSRRPLMRPAGASATAEAAPTPPAPDAPAPNPSAVRAAAAARRRKARQLCLRRSGSFVSKVDGDGGGRVGAPPVAPSPPAAPESDSDGGAGLPPAPPRYTPYADLAALPELRPFTRLNDGADAKTDSVEKSGWMHKRGYASITKWRRRWFVLSERAGTLTYYHSNLDTEPTGVIDLEGASVATAAHLNMSYQKIVGSTRKDLSTHTFTVTKKAGRTYCIYSDSNQDMQDWMDAIATVVASTRPRAKPATKRGAGVFSFRRRRKAGSGAPAASARRASTLAGAGGWNTEAPTWGASAMLALPGSKGIESWGHLHGSTALWVASLESLIDTQPLALPLFTLGAFDELEGLAADGSVLPPGGDRRMSTAVASDSDDDSDDNTPLSGRRRRQLADDPPPPMDLDAVSEAPSTSSFAVALVDPLMLTCFAIHLDALRMAWLRAAARDAVKRRVRTASAAATDAGEPSGEEAALAEEEKEEADPPGPPTPPSSAHLLFWLEVEQYRRAVLQPGHTVAPKDRTRMIRAVVRRYLLPDVDVEAASPSPGAPPPLPPPLPPPPPAPPADGEALPAAATPPPTHTHTPTPTPPPAPTLASLTWASPPVPSDILWTDVPPASKAAMPAPDADGRFTVSFHNTTASHWALLKVQADVGAQLSACFTAMQPLAVPKALGSTPALNDVYKGHLPAGTHAVAAAGACLSAATCVRELCSWAATHASIVGHRDVVARLAAAFPTLDPDYVALCVTQLAGNEAVTADWLRHVNQGASARLVLPNQTTVFVKQAPNPEDHLEALSPLAADDGSHFTMMRVEGAVTKPDRDAVYAALGVTHDRHPFANKLLRVLEDVWFASVEMEGGGLASVGGGGGGTPSGKATPSALSRQRSKAGLGFGGGTAADALSRPTASVSSWGSLMRRGSTSTMSGHSFRSASIVDRTRASSRAGLSLRGGSRLSFSTASTSVTSPESGAAAGPRPRVAGASPRGLGLTKGGSTPVLSTVSEAAEGTRRPVLSLAPTKSVISRPVLNRQGHMALVRGTGAFLPHYFGKLLTKDPLYELTKLDKASLWQHRMGCAGIPVALPKLLRSVRSTSRSALEDLHSLLATWAPFSPTDVLHVLETLDGRYGDLRARHFAVSWLGTLSDIRLLFVLPQLVQSLKHELHHSSSVALFLLHRAWRSPTVLGVPLYWALMVEAAMSGPHTLRYRLLVEAYLCYCGPVQKKVLEEQTLMWGPRGLFAAVCAKVKQYKRQGNNKARVRDFVRAELAKIKPEIPDGTALPYDPRVRLGELEVEECKVMDSAKLPLWLVFKNADPLAPRVIVMFKSGDDLRQDSVTLQLIRVMDQLWRQDQLDFKLTPYRCIATWPNGGLLEIVQNSATTADIQKLYGGSILGALKDYTFSKWIEEHNGEPGTPGYEQAVDVFMRSCAGYCVATYVMGVGDRHNDNIMVKRSGHYFHIDFGHFLGNFKFQFGIRRERSAFVFTEEMLQAIGGRDSPKFAEFLDLCAHALNTLRRNTAFLISLFSLMVPAGMPELASSEDIRYLRDMLSPESSEEEAAEKFQHEVENALKNTFKKWDNTIHIIKHGL